MEDKMKKILASALSITLLCITLFFAACTPNTNSPLQRNDWADNVKTAANDFINTYGKNSDKYNSDSYVVFDFDNTTAIFDVAHQCAFYQVKNMAFLIEPKDITNVLLSEISTNKHPEYNDYASDVYVAYKNLYEKYGPFKHDGFDEQTAKKIQEDINWKEFSAKIWKLYDLITENESSDIAVTWVGKWCYNMTEQQVYELGTKSHSYYKQVDTGKETFESPDGINSKVGKVNTSFVFGVQVTENIQELMKALNDNGIKVWICSASGINIIRSAVDVWNLHDSVTGIMALTFKYGDDGKLDPAYNKIDGCAYMTDKDGKWYKDNIPTQSVTQKNGKVDAINNVLVKKYHCGPLAGFMDSSGDYNFCTEFDSLKLVICFNRANRAVTDGGGLIAELAMYQKDTLKYDLKKANEAGDTLYVLQGRDENGKRTFRNSNKTIIYGSENEALFKNSENEIQLQYMKDNNMSTKDIINKFAIKTNAGAQNNLLGNIKYGFLDSYNGYHSICKY